MELRRCAATVGLLSAFGLAWANPLGGMERQFFGLLVALLIAAPFYELGVWWAEAALYRRCLGVTWGKALGISAVANAASLVIGFVPGPAMLPRVLLAWLVEIPIVLAMAGNVLRGDGSGKATQRLLWTVIGANLLTNVVMWAVVIGAGAAVLLS